MNNGTVAIAFNRKSVLVGYYDNYLKESCVMDFSGGYGKKALPLNIQYSIEDQKFYYENQVDPENDCGIMINDILRLIVQGEAICVYDKMLQPIIILIDFINHMISKYEKINPNNNVTELVFILDDSIAGSIKSAIDSHKERINCESCVIISQTIAVIHEIADNIKIDKLALVQFDEDGFKVNRINEKNSDILITHHKVDKTISVNQIKDSIYNELLSRYNNYYHKNDTTINERLRIKQMTDGYFSQILNGFFHHKAVSVYYNFSLPPFKETIDCNFLMETIYAINDCMTNCIDMLESSYQLILFGDGFKISYFNTFLEGEYPIVYKGLSEDLLSGGLKYIRENYFEDKKVNIKFADRIKYNIGVQLETGEFKPIIKKDMFYHEYTEKEVFVVDNSDELLTIDLLKEMTKGKLEIIDKIHIKKEREIDCKQRIAISLKVDEEDKVYSRIDYLPL